MDSAASAPKVEPIHWHDRAPALTRRDAMKLMAASIALAQGACSRPPPAHIQAFVDLPERRGGGVPLYYASAFVRDGFAHGVLVGTREGRPVKIEGNPLHPSSLGGTDVFAQASVLQLWDPDRSTSVAQRLGDGPDGAAQPMAISTWSAFDTAWQQRLPGLRAARGRGLRILTGPVTSPTLKAQLADLLERLPQARWHLHAPLADTAADAGARAAFGRPVCALPHVERARLVLALGADPFSDGPGALRLASDWARRRAAGSAPRLVAIETTPSLFGARADERIALAAARIERLWWQIAMRLLGDADPQDRTLAARIAASLRAAGRDALIVPGPALSPESHALVHVVHQRLGAFGHALDLIAPPDEAPGALTLAELVQAMAAGEVDTLIVLGSNPAYDAPPALNVAAAFARVPFSVHHALYRDETAALCRWHLPQSHVYEQWSDARGHDGSATPIQPAIAPLYDSRSAHELLAALTDDTERRGLALLRRQWAGRAGRDADAFWRDSLRRGVIDASTHTPLVLPPARMPAQPPAAPPSLELVFTSDPSVHDGSFANNGWLQELPRPFSKITWGNALQLGPATAGSLGVASGDIVLAQVAGAQVALPVWVQAGHAEGAASVTLGHGRRAAGRVGDGVGVDVQALRPAGAWHAPLRLQRTAGVYAFARTQHEMSQHGRDLARVRRDGAAAEDEPPLPSLYPEVPRGEHAWAMVIDLDACIGCNVCTVACQAENNIPVVGAKEVARGRAMHWIRVDRYDSAEPGGSVFQPVPCMHCENAPCELVCPVGATVHDDEGLNVQVYNRCIGTRFCSNNCPYKVRRFNFLAYTDATTETLKAQRNPEVTVRQRGVMEKCTYCIQRIARARQQAQVNGRPLADGDVVTACQGACPTRAIHFGDLADAQSDVAQLQASPRRYTLLGELNTRPRTTYLVRIASAAKEPE